MTRITELKRIHKHHTKEEMRTALTQFIHRKHTLHVPPDDTDADIVLADAINELLDARELTQQILDKAQTVLHSQFSPWEDEWQTDAREALEAIETLCNEHLQKEAT